MNEFRGTKGKWNLRGDVKSLEVLSSYGSICAIARQSSIDSNVDSQAEANAKLISFAPELLEALRDTLEIMYQCDPPKELHETYANAFANYNNLIREITS